MSSWRVVDKDDTASTAWSLVSLGFGNPLPSTYTVEHNESGETREVEAYDDEDLGQQIAAGNFSDDD